jgi:hypothetical protein
VWPVLASRSIRGPDDDVATVELGEQAEEWFFPPSMLRPDVDIDIDSSLTFAPSQPALT